MVDNVDSFVWNLVRYLHLAGADVETRRNDQLDLEEIARRNYEGIILSPGPGTPAAAGRLVELIHRFKEQVPMLGVCLGHQAIAEAYGARIICSGSPMHGKLAAVNHDQSGIFQALPNPIQVTRYHSLIVDRSTLPADLHISCETAEGIIMGLRHISGMLESVQFHPEAELTEQGLAMLRHFVNFCRQWKFRSRIPDYAITG